jgi:hypothetical protein
MKSAEKGMKMKTLNDLNADVKRRDEIIFGSYNPDKYIGGIRRCVCGIAMIKELLAENFIDENETQNESPSVKDFLEYVSDLKTDNIEFLCYAVSDSRCDYRITIEGVDIVIPDTYYDDISIAVELFRYADEFTFEHAWNNFYLHAWWD